MRRVVAACIVGFVALGGRPARAADPVGFEQGRDPQDTYELNTLGIAHYEVSSGWLFKSTDAWWTARRGKRRIAINDHDFFLTVGREDLATSTSARAATARAMFWGGFLAMAIGGFIAFGALDANDGELGTRGWIGLSVAGGGLVSAIAAGRVGAQLVDEDEAQRMAAEFNAALRSRLLGDGAVTAR